jgi:hypothetical protein
MPFFQRIKEIFTGHHDEEAAHDDAVTDQRTPPEKKANTPKQDQPKHELQSKKAEAVESRSTRGYLGSFMNGNRNRDFDRRAVRRAKRAPVVYEKRRPTHGNQIERLM